jgi:drug/metabolite transporter (DMT)-like permease
MNEDRTTSRLLLAALLATASELMFVSMGATVRAVSMYLPNESIVFFRNLLGLGLILPWLLRRGVGNLGTEVLRFHLLRSLAGLGAMYCFFYALAHLPLAEAILLKLTAPFFLPVIALLWLAEAVPARVRLAIVTGFAGVALVLQPGFAAVSPVALVALAGAALAAFAKVAIRRLAVTEPSTRIVFYFALIGTLVSAAPLAWSWVTPAPVAWGLLLAVGVFATAGQLAMTRAYSLAPAAQVGPFTYVSVVFAATYGWLLWNEGLEVTTLCGAALIVLAGVITVTTRSHRTPLTPEPSREGQREEEPVAASPQG